MAKRKKELIKEIRPVIVRNAASIYERSLTKFSDTVCQFTVENGNQITFDILYVSPDPDPTPRIERSITRFKEVVCEFEVIDGTEVHAYELEPVYQEIGGGPIPPDPTDDYIKEIRQGGVASGSPASNRVTLVLNTLSTDDLPHIKITLSDENISFFAVGAINNNNESLAGTYDNSNIVKVYSVNKETSYVYKQVDPLRFDATANNQAISATFGWNTSSTIDYVVTKNTTYEVSVLGLAIVFKYSDESNITPEQLRAAIRIEEV